MGLIALMMEAVRTSETLGYLHQSTQRYNPEDSHVQNLGLLGLQKLLKK
jgi:hypothetical protein